MRFWPDQPDLIIPVQWYFVDENTPFVPDAGPFRSRVNQKAPEINWNTAAEFYGMEGEAYEGVRFRTKGERPAFLSNQPLLGTAPKGSAAAWQGQANFDDAPPLAHDVIGGCIDCGFIEEEAEIHGPLRITVGVVPHFTILVTWEWPTGAVFQALWQRNFPATYLAIFSGASVVEGNPPKVIFHPTRWLASVVGDTIMLTATTPSPDGGPSIVYLWAGVRSDTTVPLIGAETFPGSGINTTMIVPGYAPLEDANMLIGSIVWDAGSDALPAHYLLCDGSAVSRQIYSLLFGRIGTTYGPGDGALTFNLPNLRDRSPIGSTGLYATGQQLGEATHTLNAAELPAAPINVVDPGHSHHAPDGVNSTLSGPTGARAATSGTGGVAGMAFGSVVFYTETAVSVTGITGTINGGNQGHNNIGPSLALRPLIYTGL